MAQLTAQNLDLTGLTPTFSPADALGDTFQNTGKEILIVDNQGANDITITIDSQTPCNYGFDHDVSITVPAGTQVEVGVFPVVRFNDANGNVNISYSDTTNVQVAVIKIS